MPFCMSVSFNISLGVQACKPTRDNKRQDHVASIEENHSGLADGKTRHPSRRCAFFVKSSTAGRREQNPHDSLAGIAGMSRLEPANAREGRQIFTDWESLELLLRASDAAKAARSITRQSLFTEQTTYDNAVGGISSVVPALPDPFTEDTDVAMKISLFDPSLHHVATTPRAMAEALASIEMQIHPANGESSDGDDSSDSDSDSVSSSVLREGYQIALERRKLRCDRSPTKIFVRRRDLKREGRKAARAASLEEDEWCVVGREAS